MIVYAITNLVNGRRYIGITEYSLKVRWSGHKKYARDVAKTALHRAMKKHGIENFAICELARLAKGSDRDALCELEKFYIAKENTLTPHGYNMTPGGDGMPKGASNPNLGKKLGEDFSVNCRNSWTPERRAAAAAHLAARNKVKNQSAEHKAKLKEAWAKNPGRRAKGAATMNEVRRKHPETAEAKEARVARFNVMRTSDETKAKFSANMLRIWNERRSTVQ